MATFGLSGGSGAGFPGSGDRCLVSRYLCSTSGTITSISGWLGTDSATGCNVKLVVLNDAAGAPGTFLTSTAGIASVSGGGAVSGAATGSVVGGNYYWVGFVADDFQATYGQDPGVGGAEMANGTFSYSSPPTWPGTDASYTINIFALVTYTESGGTTDIALAATEAQDTAALAVSQSLAVSLAATEAQDTSTMALGQSLGVSLAATEAQDNAAITLSVGYQISLAATEAQDTADFAISQSLTVALAATEAQDTAALAIGQSLGISLAATEPQDTADFTLGLITSVDMALAATEAQDTAALTLGQSLGIALSATEAQDTAAITLSLLSTVDMALAATEAQDTANISLSSGSPSNNVSYSGGGGGTGRSPNQEKFYRELNKTIEEMVNPQPEVAAPVVAKPLNPVLNEKLAKTLAPVIPQNPKKPAFIEIDSDTNDEETSMILLLLFS